MTTILLMIIAAFLDASSVPDGLRATAPTYLTPDAAREHAIAAFEAAWRYDVDPYIVLSIAHHESRYQHRVRFREAVGGHSCGVMTPEPLTDQKLCDEAMSSIAAGYFAGARHLRTWLDHPRCQGDLYCALSGYAGGTLFMDRCRDTPSQYPTECAIPGVFLYRAQLIRRASKAIQGVQRGYHRQDPRS